MGITSQVTDGERIAIWDLEKSGDPVVIARAHDAWLTTVVFAPNGALVSCGQAWRDVRGPDGKVVDRDLAPRIRIWDAGSGRMLRELDPTVDHGQCQAALSPDGRTLVSAHNDCLLVWDLASGTIARRIDSPASETLGKAGGIVISPDGNTVAAERDDYVVHLWDLATGKPRFTEDAAHDTTIAATISPDGRLAATGDDAGNVRIWDPAQGTLSHQLEMGGRGRVWSLRFSPDGRSLAAAGESFDRRRGFLGHARVWDVPGFMLRHHLPLDQRAVCVEFSPNGGRLAVGSWDSGGRGRPAVKHGRGPIDNAIDLFDATTGRSVVELPGHKGRIHAMAFAPDGRSLVSAGEDNVFRFWDVAAGRQTRELPIEGHRRGANLAEAGRATVIEVAAISRDLKTAVTSGLFADQLLVWALPEGRAQRTLEVGTYVEGALAITPDGRLLAAAMTPTGDGLRIAPIRIWDIATKRELIRLEPGVNFVRSLAFSADGDTLVSGMSDTTALVWDVSAVHERPASARD